MSLPGAAQSQPGVGSENFPYAGGGCANIDGAGHRGTGEREREAGMGALKGDMAKTGRREERKKGHVTVCRRPADRFAGIKR